MAARTSGGRGTATEEQVLLWRNEVVLKGRLAAPAAEREMPSGDLLTTWRLIVDRPTGRTGRDADGRRSPTVDTIECAAWRADVRRRVSGWAAGDVVEVEGALRRRFWRAGAQAVSRCEVEVERVRRVGRAPAPAPPRRPRGAGAGTAAAP